MANTATTPPTATPARSMNRSGVLVATCRVSATTTLRPQATGIQSSQPPRKGETPIATAAAIAIAHTGTMLHAAVLTIPKS